MIKLKPLLAERKAFEPKTKKNLKQSMVKVINDIVKGKKPLMLVNGMTGEVLGDYSSKGPTGGRYEFYLSSTEDAFRELK
jgi:hypothetical protein|tara:strand:- start:803 stop:1042 length:240 start_codon:yes stop_codon:yes gene_type:complete